MSRKVIVVGALILALVAAYMIYDFRVRDAEDAAICRTQYRHAPSAADSARIDGQLAPRLRGNGEQMAPNLTCGELRRLGRTN